jgi:hypothetical protein
MKKNKTIALSQLHIEVLEENKEKFREICYKEFKKINRKVGKLDKTIAADVNFVADKYFDESAEVFVVVETYFKDAFNTMKEIMLKITDDLIPMEEIEKEAKEHGETVKERIEVIKEVLFENLKKDFKFMLKRSFERQFNEFKKHLKELEKNFEDF